MSDYESDLAVLVADSNTGAAVRGLLARQESLGIRVVEYELYVHPERDSGCFLRAHDFLRPMHRRCAHALVLFDCAGSGRERLSRDALEDEVATRLSQAGWGERAAVVVLDPELEVWVWSGSPEVDRCLGWHGRQPDLRSWLAGEGLWNPRQAKPDDPKLATERALRKARKPRSSAVYEQLARRVSLQGCTDAAFVRLVGILKAWFPAEPNP